MTLTFVEGLNYNNRIIETKLTTPQDFRDAGYTILDSINNIDFVPNDGVMTKQIIRWDVSNNDTDYFRGRKEPSYLIVYDDIAEEYTHWWVLENVRTRLGQYEITLLRDVIKDYYPDVKDSVLFVEKGTVSGNSPLVFNSEGMLFNQIKKKETLLKDKSNCPWLVGYIDKSATVTGTLPRLESPYAKISSSFDTWYQDGETLYQPFGSTYLSIWAKGVAANNNGQLFKAEMGFNRGDTVPVTGINYIVNPETTPENVRFKNTSLYNSATSTSLAAPAIFNALLDTDMSNLTYAVDALNIPNVVTSFEWSALEALGNRYVEDINGRVCWVSLRTKTPVQIRTSISGGELFNLLKSIAEKSFIDGEPLMGGTPNIDSFEVITVHRAVQIVLTDMDDYELSYTIGAGRASTLDAPYDIFCIPYGNITVEITETDTPRNLLISPEVSMRLANSIIVNGADKIYDVQLVPYCPIPELIKSEGVMSVPEVSAYVSIIQESADLPGTAIFYCTQSSFSFDIQVAENADIVDFSNPLQVKIGNDCKLFRLCSPNYSNYFDFSVAKNGGVNAFNVDCAYKPYSPYIHINPVFDRMYGSDFNDVRGVILGGDFSLTIVKDAWESYQVNNKYYQQTFDRQIQNLDTNWSIQKDQMLVQASLGALSQGLQTGAMASFAYGGKAGAALGVAAGALSLHGGLADQHYAKLGYNEQRDYALTMQNYSLRTIQAIPDTISKVTSYNPNNKVFPVLEEYDATDEEKIIYAKNLCYTGMTIKAVGNIDTYTGTTYSYNGHTTQNYIKAQVIRFGDYSPVDSHIIDAVAAELGRGVYIR